VRRAALLVALVAAVAGCGGSSSSPSYVGTRPPDGITMPAFSLRDYRGARVTSASLVGKAVALTFLDSACKESCPVIAHEMGRAAALLDAGDRGRVAFYAITVDPRVDSPAHVRAFLRREGALGSVGYLLGAVGELRPVWRAFHVLPAVDTGRASVHSAPVRIYAPGGTWVSELDPTVDLTPQNLAHDLRAALDS
jgi:cytochrome oxidase Cu insertion factor (SCO1/SenC/PrrC family)